MVFTIYRHGDHAYYSHDQKRMLVIDLKIFALPSNLSSMKMLLHEPDVLKNDRKF